MQHGDVILTFQWRHRSTCSCSFFYLSHGLVRVFEINRIHHWCSVLTEKSQPEGPPFHWETRLAEFPTERWTQGRDFSGTTEHQWLILFLIYHDRTVQYCVISVGDVTEVDVYSQWRAMYNKLETANKQRIKQWTNGYFIKMDLQELAYHPQ